MPRSGLLLLAVVLQACAQVPSSVCFAGEPCADGGQGGGGATGGGVGGGGSGGGVGGGMGGGGGGATGGGVGGGAGGGGGGGGLTRTPITGKFSSEGIADTWAEVLAGLPETAPSPPGFTRIEATLPGSLGLTTGCPEAFRGAIALPDGRALAIPACAPQFALIDVDANTAAWVGPALASSSVGRYGGAVLGCDLRVYALPADGARPVMRVTVDAADGGLGFEELPVVAGGGLALSGGVVARPCTEGMRIVAGGVGALYALDVYEELVDVTALPVPGAAGRRIDGVARIGDAQVVGAPANGTTDAIVPWVDARSLQVRTSVRNFAVAPRFGLAARRQGDAFYVTEDGVAAHELADGGSGAVRTFAGSRLRWPTNSLDGWLFVAGADLLAYEEAPTMPGTDVVSVSPATSSAGAYTSGGLVLTTSGALVNVPGATSTNAITIYQPVTPGTASAGQVCSPWFDKL